MAFSVGVAATTIVQVSGSSDLTAIVAIAVAGVVGPALGYLAAWRSDLRRFQHERKLKARDDLVALLDDVEVALDAVGEACAVMRNECLRDVGDRPRVGPAVETAVAAYEDARGMISRLGMRPHASPEPVGRAKKAATAMREAIQTAQLAMLAAVGGRPDQAADRLGLLPAQIENAYREIRTYEDSARNVVGRLLDKPAKRRRRKQPSPGNIRV